MQNYNDPNDDKRELFIETYLCENMVHDFPEAYMAIEDFAVIAPFMESHFEGFTDLEDKKDIIEFANLCYKADKPMLTVFFNASSTEECEGLEILMNTNLSQRDKMLVMGFSIAGIERVVVWMENAGLDIERIDPCEAFVEFKSVEAVVEHFNLDSIENLEEMGSWELLENDHVLFMY